MPARRTPLPLHRSLPCPAALPPSLSAQPLPSCRSFRRPDVALVLAIDSSLSIDGAEFALQMDGYAAAFRDPALQEVLARAGTVDVAAVIWADAGVAPQRLAWHRIEDRAGAERLAQGLRSIERRVSGHTGVGVGLAAALDLIEAHGCADRRLVNLSGDGRETRAPRAGGQDLLAASRQRTEALGVTVNALAVAGQQPDLSDWYRGHVISGQGAFVMETRDFAGFADAIAQKLRREIAPLQIARPDPPKIGLAEAGLAEIRRHRPPVPTQDRAAVRPAAALPARAVTSARG